MEKPNLALINCRLVSVCVCVGSQAGASDQRFVSVVAAHGISKTTACVFREGSRKSVKLALG